MNALDVLFYGHREVYQAFNGLRMEDWTRVGVTTRWSLKDMAAHLASFEVLLEEAAKTVLGEPIGPTLQAKIDDDKGFNDAQVAARQELSSAEILMEYDQAHQRAVELVKKIGPEKMREAGTLPWYGKQYGLDDYIVYTNYGHKREHVAQIKRFRQTLTG